MFITSITLLFISGASLYFWFETLAPKQGWTSVLYRFSLLVFGFLALKWFVLGHRIPVWEVLITLGFLTLILWMLKGRSPRFYLVTSIIIFILAVPLQIWIGPEDYWYKARYFVNCEMCNIYNVYDLKIMVTGFFVTGWYPVFPWLGFGFLGYWFASYLEKGSFKKPQMLAYSALLIGIVSLIIGYAFLGGNKFVGFGMWPIATLPTILIYSAVNILLTMGIYKVFDENKKALGYISNIFYNIGQNAIKFYISAIILWELIMKNTNYDLYGFWDAALVAMLMNLGLYVLFRHSRYKPHDQLGQKDKKSIIS